MLQITFLVIGLCIIVLALSFVFKKYARLILWSSAITIFTGTLLLVGVGAINPVDGDVTGSITFFPDTELKILFGVSDIGQSRQNRKDLATPKKSQEIDKLFE